MIYKDFISPLTGRLVPIEDVPDELFRDRIMGDGFAIELSGNVAISPLTGVVRSVFPSGHAVCIESDEGIQVLIHIGLDTHQIANLYQPLVKKEQRVSMGNQIIKIDYNKMKKTGKSLMCPIVFLNGEQVTVHKLGEDVVQGDRNIVTIQKQS